MVAPLALALGGISAASSIADFFGKSSNAKKQAEAERIRFERTKAASIESMLFQSGQVRRREAEGNVQIGIEIENIVTQSLSTRGDVAVSAASAGVAGVSVTDEIVDIKRTEARSVGQLRLLQEFRAAKAASDIRGLRIQTRNRINAAIPGPVFKPNPLALGFNAITAGASGFALGNSILSAL